MKTMKRLAALLLTVCILVGMPMSVSAVGTAAPSELKLIGAQAITAASMPNLNINNPTKNNAYWRDKGVHLYFSRDLTLSDYRTTAEFYVAVVDAENNIVKYGNQSLIWADNGNVADSVWGLPGSLFAVSPSVTGNNWTGLINLLATADGLAGQNYRIQVRIRELTNTSDNYVDSIAVDGMKLKANMKVDATGAVGGTLDCAAVDIGTVERGATTITPTGLVALQSVVMNNQTHMTLTFSEAVTVDTARTDAVLQVVKADGTTVVSSYPVSLTAGGTATVGATLTNTTWTQIDEVLSANLNSSARLKLTEKNTNTAWDERSFNFAVDTVWSTNTNMPVQSYTGYSSSTPDYLYGTVTAPKEELTIKKAQPVTLAGQDYVVLTFSHPVTVASARYFCLRKISAGAASNGQPVGGINVTLDYQGYYGASGKQILTKLRSGSIADIRTQAGTLGDTYRLVVMTIDKVDPANTPDGYEVDSIYATQDSTVKLTANLSNSAEDRTVIDLDETAIDSIRVEGVHVYKERNLIVTFDRAVVAQPNLYSAIRLVDENNTLYFADDTNGNATVYSAASAGTATKHLQWQVSANAGASRYGTYGTSGRQLLGTLGIDYSKLLEIEKEAEAYLNKELHLSLCFEENNVNSQYGLITKANYVVDSVYAADGSSYLAANKSGPKAYDGYYIDLTDVVNATLADAYAVSGSAVEFVFSAPVRTDVYSATKGVNVTLNVIKADGTPFKLNTGYAPFYNGTLVPVAASGNAADGYTQWQLTDLYQAAYGNKKIDIQDILAAMSADEGQFAGCSLRLTLTQNIDNGDIAGWIDNVTDADGVCRLRANSGDTACVVTVDPVDTPAVTIEKIAVINERQLKITFSEEVAKTAALSGQIRLVDADGYVVAGDANGAYGLKAANGKAFIQWTGDNALVPLEGESDDEWIFTIKWAAHVNQVPFAPLSFSRIYERWESEWKDLGYSIVFNLETDTVAANGLIDTVYSTATGRKLVCNNLLGSRTDRAGWNDFARKDITTCDFFKTGNPQVTAVKQYSDNQVLVSFDQPVRLNGSVTPWTSIRLVNAGGELMWLNLGTNNNLTTSAYASYADGSAMYWNTVTKSATDDPICKDAQGNVQYNEDGTEKTNPRRQNTPLQWGASGLSIVNDGYDILFTFAENVDVAALIDMDSLLEYMKQDGYSMQLVIEEKDPGDGLYTTADTLVANIINANGRQLLANRKTGNNAYCAKIELIDPDAPVTVTDAKITGESEITLTFSEAVNLAGNMNIGLLRYVDKDTYRVFKTEDGYVQWSGILSYANDTKTQLRWTLRSNNPANKNLVAANLAEVVELIQTKESLKSLNGVLALCLEETGTNKTMGFIDSFYAESGKVIEAQPLIPGWNDGIYIPIDTAKVIDGELKLVSAEAVSDNELVVTFSAPIALNGEAWYCIRLFDAKNNLLFDGKTPMQWGLTVKSVSEDGKQMRLALQGSNLMPVHNLTDILAYDWNTFAEGAHIRFFIEEKGSQMVPYNSHMDNIVLKSDGRIHLDATDFNERDGAGMVITQAYTPVTLSTTATVINESQLRITFSRPVTITGDVYMALCYVDEDYNLLSHLGLNKHYPQWGGSWEWENESKTSMIWTMSAGMYGCKTISDVVNKTGMLADLYPDAKVQFRIEEKSTDACKAVGQTGLVDNISTAGGTVHLTAKGSGMDRHFVSVSNTKALAGDEVTLLSVKALDNMTLELTFSEAVAIKDGDRAPIMAIRYLTASGDTEVGIDGRTLSFTGNWEYKDENKNVIVWKLDTEKAAKRGASSLDDLFTFAGDFQWNSSARISFVIMDEEEVAFNGAAMRVGGITDVSGYRNLVANRGGEISQVQMDIEIAYDLPVTVEEVTETVYITNYLPYILAGAAVVVAGIVIAVTVGVKRRKKED